MEHEEQVLQIKTMLERIDSDTNVDAGCIRHNPTWVYTDPALAAREWDEFFQGHPHIVGLSGDLPDPGSFLTLDDLGVPILATRDADGMFRAFVNSCRHRGVVLEERERGTERRFTCSFHSWCYDGTGALVGLPKKEHFGDIDESCHGLVELRAVEQYGLLWVHPDPGGAIDVDDLLGPVLAAELASWDFGSFSFLGNDTYDVACNWKLAMDTFGETYHFPSLHSDTLGLFFHGNVQCYDTYEKNHRMLLCKRDIDAMRHLSEDQWDITVATLPVYWLFPNVQLMPHGAGVYLVRAYPDPLDPGRHMSRISFYLGAEQAADPAVVEMFGMMSQQFAEVIRDEDYAVSASQQRSAASGVLDHVVFGRNEPALHHYHGTYRAALGMEPLQPQG